MLFISEQHETPGPMIHASFYWVNVSGMQLTRFARSSYIFPQEESDYIMSHDLLSFLFDSVLRRVSKQFSKLSVKDFTQQDAWQSNNGKHIIEKRADSVASVTLVDVVKLHKNSLND